MDRRSWLWRRKSSEKISGETESSGSMSSHSERFSDDQASNIHIQSPEVTSKAAPSDEELNGSMRTLTEKLSAALLNIRAKEDLVKQHSRVAEEAVSGWEKAENELVSLKQKLEAATQRNSLLEYRVDHLDGALKECMRQLRQAREEQEQNICEAIANDTREWESTKFELESQVLKLQAQIEANNVPSVYSDLHPKLEALDKGNSKLKLELLAITEKLELRTIERDLSTQSAETASKQHLESIRKVAKLEAECRRLKAVARKVSPANDHRSVTTSSVYVESLTDSQSDSGERLLVVENDTSKMRGLEQYQSESGHSDSWAIGRTHMVPSVEIDLMDDFLEMERLAASPEVESAICYPETGVSLDKPNDSERALRAELEAMSNRIAGLEMQLEKMDAEKVELEMNLSECQYQFKRSEIHLEETKAKVLELQTQLAMVSESRRAAVGELEATEAKREAAESRLRDLETEIKTLVLKVSSMDEELEKERKSSGKFAARCQKLETQLASANKARRAAEGELEDTKANTEVANSRLGDLEAEIRTLLLKVSSVDEELQKEQESSRKFAARCQELETELAMANEARTAAEGELEATGEKTEVAESRVRDLDAEIKALLMKVSSLEEDLQKERESSGKFAAKCQRMEYEILKLNSEAGLVTAARSNAEMKSKQDKEMAVASSKFAECKKTIESLGKQLKSLATLEDLLLDSEKSSEVLEEGSHYSKDGGELQKSRYSGLYAPKRDFEAPKVVTDVSISFSDNMERDSQFPESHSLITSEKSRNAFGKFFPRSKSRE